MYPRPIQKLITAFSRLPSVGGRTAERFVFHLLKSGKKDVAELSNALKDLMEQVQSCAVCWDFSDRSPCPICSDPKRDREIVCVVAESQDVQAIERTSSYHGLYHVLRGMVKPDEENFLERLKIPELFSRVQSFPIREVILALSPDMAGETTMLFLEKKLQEIQPRLLVTRLARGLPMGSDLQYADEITLESALKNRVKLQE